MPRLWTSATCISWCNMDRNFITFIQIGFIAKFSGLSRKRSPNRCSNAASQIFNFMMAAFNSCALWWSNSLASAPEADRCVPGGDA